MGALKSPKCSKGHPMKAPNLYLRPDGNRECLTCKRRRNAQSQQSSRLLRKSAKSGSK